MRYFFLTCCICCASLIVAPSGNGATEVVSGKEAALPTELVYPERIIRKDTLSDGSLTLSTPLAVYENGEGKFVYLVGAVHIGEKEYYEELNKRFSGYDAVLFEMVGGEKMQRELELENRKKDGSITEAQKKELIALNEYLKKESEKANGFLRLLSGQYAKIATTMGVASQKDGIDYSPSKFIHADMTREEMDNAQKAKGESMLGLMIAGVFKSLTTPKKEYSPDMTELIRAVKKEDKDTLKKIFIEMMASQVSDELLVKSVLLEGRNDKCLSVFDRVIEEKPDLKKIAIFYGAAHLTDLHEKLGQRGYQLSSVEWIPAWRTAAPATADKAEGKAPDSKESPPVPDPSKASSVKVK